MGEQSVKNIARPVRVFALRPEIIADLPTASAPSPVSIFQTAVAPRLSIVDCSANWQTAVAAGR